jgi:hypothetical protein
MATLVSHKITRVVITALEIGGEGVDQVVGLDHQGAPFHDLPLDLLEVVFMHGDGRATLGRDAR